MSKLSSKSESVIYLGCGAESMISITAQWTLATPIPVFEIFQQATPLPAEELIALLEEAIITIRAFHKNE